MRQALRTLHPHLDYVAPIILLLISFHYVLTYVYGMSGLVWAVLFISIIRPLVSWLLRLLLPALAVRRKAVDLDADIEEVDEEDVYSGLLAPCKFPRW